MNGKTTMQVNQATALEAFQLWANKHFKTSVKLLSVSASKGAGYNEANGFELVFEPLAAAAVNATNEPTPTA
jgi:hypothetical protein